MEEFTKPVKTIAEWEKDLTEAYQKNGYYDKILSFRETYHIPVEHNAAMDQYTKEDNQLLNRLVACYRAEIRRFDDYQPGMFGAFLLAHGGLNPDQIAGIIGVALARISSLVAGDEPDPMEGLLDDSPKT